MQHIPSTPDKKIFLSACLLLITGFTGLFVYLCYPDYLIQLLTWLRRIVGKNYNFEVQEYYFRKYLWLICTVIFSGSWGFLLCWIVPSADWKDHTRFWKWLLITSAAFGIFFRVFSWATHFLWNDTLLLAASVKGLSCFQLFGPLGNGQSAPLLFVLIAKFFGECFGYTHHVLGFFPLLLSLGSLWLFYRVTCRIFAVPVTRFFCMSLFAINTSLCFYAGEFKQYTGDLFCLLLILDQLQLALQRTGNYNHLSGWECMRTYYRENWKLLISGLLSLLLSQAAIFSVTASGIILFFEWIIHKRGFKRGCVSLFSLLALWAAGVLGTLVHILWVLPSMMYDYHAAWFAPFPVSLSGLKWYISFFTHAVKYPYGLAIPLPFCWIFFLLLFIAGAVYFICVQRKQAAALLIPLLLVYLASLFKHYPVSAIDNVIDSRLILFTVPLIILLLAGGIECFRTWNKKIFQILILICWISAVFISISATPFYENSASLLKIMQNTQQDILIIYTNYPGWIAIDLTEDFPKKNIRRANLEDKDLFHSKDYFPVPGKYWVFCIHSDPQDTCMMNLPQNVKIRNYFRHSGSFLYELERVKDRL